MKSEVENTTHSSFYRIHFWGQYVARFVLASFLIIYGMAKLLGTQFFQSGALLDEPLSEISGFELTWAYFGYSSLYSHFIALGQIFFAALLLFDRTKRLGMLGLLPIILNIVLVNYEYNISSETMIVSCAFLVLNLYLVFSEFDDLKRFFWDESVKNDHRYLKRFTGVIRAFLLLAMIGGAWIFISLIKTNFMAETPVSGDWAVRQVLVDKSPVEPGAEFGGGWKKVYFDFPNRFGILTNCGIIHGKYELDGSQITINYDPTPYWRSAAAVILSQGTGDETPLPLDESERKPPTTLVGEYELASDRSFLKITGTGDNRQFEIILVPWVWNKY
jgi:hypothetical protein